MRFHRRSDLPAGFGDFTEEIASALARMHGPRTAEAYARHACDGIARALKSGAAALYAAEAADGAVHAAALVHERGGTAHLSMLHARAAMRNQGIEQRLAAEIASDLKARGASHILAEFVPAYPLDLSEALEPSGFTAIPRCFMSIESRALAGPPRAPVSRAAAYDPAVSGKVAHCLHRAYDDPESRFLHHELNSMAAIEAFVCDAARGTFGATQRGFGRLIEEDGAAAGVALGCGAGPDAGFVLQVAVDPSHRRKGLATQLLRDLGREFLAAGFTRTSLTVTASNPARILYERLGFRAAAPVTAYVWWRDGGPRAAAAEA